MPWAYVFNIDTSIHTGMSFFVFVNMVSVRSSFVTRMITGVDSGALGGVMYQFTCISMCAIASRGMLDNRCRFKSGFLSVVVRIVYI